LNAIRPSPTRWAIVVNFVVFEAGWFACVIGAARHEARVGLVAAAAILLGSLIVAGRAWPRQLLLLASVALIGFCWDSLLSVAGLTVYAGSFFGHQLAPAWIVALWALFAMTLDVSLRWLQGRTVLAMALGFIAAPLSYYGGVRMGALVLPRTALALWAEGVGWGTMLPGLLLLARRIRV
jgi:hypothetical protein